MSDFSTTGGGRVGPSTYEIYVEVTEDAGGTPLSKTAWLASQVGPVPWDYDLTSPAWDEDTAYVARDAVTHLGSFYVAAQSDTGTEPGTDETVWVKTAGGVDDDTIAAVTAAKVDAEAAADAAALAGAAVGSYESTAAGLAAVTEGQYFWAPSGTSLQLYRDLSGVATAQAGVTLPLKTAVDAVDKRATRSLGTIGGTADAITAVASPVITAYEVDQSFYLTPTATNTGAATLAIDGLAARAVRNSSGDPLVAGDLLAGRQVTLRNGTSFFTITTVPVRATEAQMIAGTDNEAMATAATTSAALDDRLDDFRWRAMPVESGWLVAFQNTETLEVLMGVLRHNGKLVAALDDRCSIPVTTDTASFSTTDIACWGDSLTFGNQDGTGVTYPQVLADMLDVAVYNGGVGGETSDEILTRFIAGTQYYGSVAILGMGRNNYNDAPQVLADIASAVALLTPRFATVFVLSVYNGNYNSGIADEWLGGAEYEEIDAINRELALTYGPAFIDDRAYLVEFGLRDAAITPTAFDLVDIAHDVIPTSLRTVSKTGTLTSTITDSATSFGLTMATGTLAAGDFVDIGTERISVTSISGSTITACVRGFGGTTAAAHTGGAAFQIVDKLHPNGACYTVKGNFIGRVMRGRRF